MSNVTIIEKENVKTLSFPAGEVLETAEARRRRLNELVLATRLGNLEQGKVRIRFMTTSGTHEVYTTIWHADDNHIVLKGGMSIPVRCVLSVGI